MTASVNKQITKRLAELEREISAVDTEEPVEEERRPDAV
jgi:hypothetical protein